MRKIFRGPSSHLLKTALLGVCLAAPDAHAAITLSNLFSFGANYTNTDGMNPATGLLLARDGSYYGVAPNGGTNGYGMAFKITTNGVYTALASFTSVNGANPACVLAQTPDGNFYGTTTYGGTYDLGSVFKLTPSGALTAIAMFDGTNGANPTAGLVLATNGILYGTAQYGGANDADFGGDGTVFKVTTNGVLTRIYSFADGNDGANPVAALIQAKDGNFYGGTPGGGADFSGVIFKITAAGSLTPLHAFTGGADGGNPDAELIQGKDGNFYGTTALGGTNDVDNGGDGTVFKMSAAGAITRLVSFNTTNGNDPEAGLIQGTDGVLYGTTASGGIYGDGTAFKVTTNGVFTNLVSFNGVNGGQPQATLAPGTNGVFYGTTINSGVDNLPGGSGLVFKLATNGVLSTLYLFGDNNPNGAVAVARMAAGPDGSLYGTTVYGGTNHGNYGTIYRLTTNGVHTVLNSLNGTNGAYPQAALVLGADGNFYGTTAYGGTNGTGNGGDGTVFRVATNGVLASLASFNFTNGANPAAELARGPDGNFYGTAQNGGTNNTINGGNGTVFRITTNGVLTHLASFNTTNGANPAAGLALGPDGNFYGTTVFGGVNDVADGGDGIVFRVTTNGVLTRLLSFAGTNGANPQGILALGTNGIFYGTTYNGGAGDSGTVFKVTTNGVLTRLYSFSGGNDGGNPAAGLTQGDDGNFYGTTLNGGTDFNGVVFQITPAGVFTVVYSLIGETDGGSPAAGLVEGAANHFYGATESGGTNNLGTLFNLFVDPFPSIINQPDDVTEFAGATATFTLSALGASPLSYQWQRSATNLSDHANIHGSSTSSLTLSNITLADAASYTVIVSNFAGMVTSSPASLTVVNPFAPAVSTDDPPNVGITAATFNASANPDGAATAVWFLWGVTTNYGSSTVLTNIGSGGDTVDVSLAVAGLQPFTTYHYSAIASNALGTNTGGDAAFMTYGARSNVIFTPLLSFGGTNGSNPQGALLSGGTNLYGTTYEGGVDDIGTIFKMSTNGAVTVLQSFNGTNGSHPAAGLAQATSGVLYGTTFDGGTNDLPDGGYGTVFRITTNGVFTSLVSFNATNGANPMGGVTPGPDGQFYGTTSAGGTNDLPDGGYGTIFAVTSAGVLTSLLSFDQTNNGATPDTGLTAGAGGVFYGTTSAGGPDDSGTIFKISTNGTFTLLYAFTGDDDGADPESALLLASDGNLYGTTFSGGADGYGTVFEITTSGVLNTLYSFTGDVDGANPEGTLVQGADGNLYGTTTAGGPEGYGNIFLVTTGGAFASLVLFDSDSFGANPQAGLAQTADGTFYGTAGAGGTNGSGTVFRFRLAPAPAILVDPVSQTNFSGTSVSFSAAATGNTPLTYHWRHGTTNLSDNANITGSGSSSVTISNLTLGDAGSYSLVVSNSSGTATSAVASLTVMNPFPPAVTTEPATGIAISGATLNAIVNPDGAATAVSFGYGITPVYDHSVTVTNLAADGDPVSVSGDISGLAPFTLYHFAVTAGNAAGTNTGSDLTFLTPGARSGVSFTPLISFADTNGADPEAALLQGVDGAFYGTTSDGGDNDLGTVYKLTSDGTLTTLWSFDGTSGANPSARLIQGADGQLYGTAAAGGTNDADSGGDGTVFSITTNGVLTRFISFDGTNGANPAAGLVFGPDGQFYGTTFAGGTNDVDNGGDGTVFRFATNGGIINLASFAGTNGANPSAPLALGPDANFYGTTVNGGTNDVATGGDGTIFKVTTNGVITRLVSFNGTNGASPVGGLTLGTDGNFYGTTESGGVSSLNDGTVFRVTTAGVLTTLYSFTGGIDGASPQSDLVLSTDGNFYGTTSAGGSDDNGTLFQITPDGVLTTLVLFDFDTYGANPTAGMIVGADGQLYGVAQTGGTNSNGTIFQLSAPPTAPLIQTPILTGTTVLFTWNAINGRAYLLQYRTNLTQTNWFNLTNVTAVGSTASAFDTVDISARRYYRVTLGASGHCP